MYTLIGIIICFVINKILEQNKIKNLKTDDMIEFAKNSKLIDSVHHAALVRYFASTGTSIQNVNNFLNSKKGMAFLSSYSKKKDIDFVSISQLITLSDRNEQLISNAVNIVNEV
jgi:3,4-dihydroxy-2-butanone 4-phosphate synthase